MISGAFLAVVWWDGVGKFFNREGREERGGDGFFNHGLHGWARIVRVVAVTDHMDADVILRSLTRNRFRDGVRKLRTSRCKRMRTDGMQDEDAAGAPRP